MVLYKRVCKRILAISVVAGGVLLVGGAAHADTSGSASTLVTNPEEAESPRPATLRAQAICRETATSRWSITWSFSTQRDGNNVVILSSSLPTEAWYAGAHLMPDASMPDHSQWPEAASSAITTHVGLDAVTETLSFRLLPDDIGQPYNDGHISLTIASPCPEPEPVPTTSSSTPATTVAPPVDTTVRASEPTTTLATVATVASTSTTQQKTAVAAAVAGPLPSTGRRTSETLAAAFAFSVTGAALLAIDRKRRHA